MGHACIASVQLKGLRHMFDLRGGSFMHLYLGWNMLVQVKEGPHAIKWRQWRCGCGGVEV